MEKEHEDGTRLAMYSTDKNTLVISVTKPNGENNTWELVKIDENAGLLRDNSGEILASAEMTPQGTLLFHEDGDTVELSNGQLTQIAEMFMEGETDMAVHQLRATINGKMAFAR